MALHSSSAAFPASAEDDDAAAATMVDKNVRREGGSRAADRMSNDGLKKYLWLVIADADDTNADEGEEAVMRAVAIGSKRISD